VVIRDAHNEAALSLHNAIHWLLSVITLEHESGIGAAEAE
jgi:hypothetical protein